MKQYTHIKLYFLVLFTICHSVVFSQTIINYQTWTGATGCNIFANSTNVPVTINGASGNIEHLTAIGQPTYDIVNHSANIDCRVLTGSQNHGTEYSTTVNFKAGYSYKL